MDNPLNGFADWLKNIVTEAIQELYNLTKVQGEATMWTKKEVCKQMRINTATFDDHYRYAEDFPKEHPAVRWKSAEVMAWLNGTYKTDN